ncbi:MAG: LysR family transcriptional regulator [Opitutaceae bacterium]
MELRHLRYFVAVAEEENVTRAAARLHVSQPPLTRQIHDLEDELGFALFDRTGKAVRLTDAGRVFLDEVRTVLARIDSAVTAARTVAEGVGGELHVGYAPSPTAGFLPEALRAFQRRAPGVRVTLHDQTSPEMLAGLREGRLHAALIMEPPRAAAPGIVFEPVRSHAMVVAVPPAHRFARKRGLTVADVVREPIVVLARNEYPDYHALLGRVLGRRFKEMRIGAECDSGMSLIAAVEAGKGVAFVVAGLSEIAGRRLRFVALAPPLLRGTVGIAYRPEALTVLARTFLEVVRARREL